MARGYKATEQILQYLHKLFLLGQMGPQNSRGVLSREALVSEVEDGMDQNTGLKCSCHQSY